MVLLAPIFKFNKEPAYYTKFWDSFIMTPAGSKFSTITIQYSEG